MPKEIKVALACIVLSCLFLHAFFILSESKPASTDVFLFKEAGIQWAKTGKFQVQNLPHLPFDHPTVYSYYPPLFPFIFGVWTKVVGVGLTQSMLFDTVLRILRSLVLCSLLLPFFKSALKQNKFSIVIAAFGLIWLLSFFTTEPDRPDELAMIFGLWTLACLQNRRWIAAGILLGLCGLTSPAAGVLFALCVVLSCLKEFKIGFRIAALSALTYLLISLPVYLQKDSVVNFSQQLTYSVFPYLFSEQKLGAFLGAFAHYVKLGWSFALVLVLLFAFQFIYFRNEKNPLFKACLIYAPLSFLIWPLQHYYLWFVILVSLVVFLEQIPKLKSPIPVLLLALSFAPFFFRELKAGAHAIERPLYESSVSVRKAVLGRMDSQSRLAISEDQFFTFRDMKYVDNIGYVCSSLNKYDFIYVTPRSRHRSRPTETPIACRQDSSCFKPVLDLKTNQVFKVLGFETPYYVAGNGGTLYQNTCSPKHLASN